MDEEIEKGVTAWREAAIDLGIRVESPYTITGTDGRQVTCIAYLPDFGSRRGVMIKPMAMPDEGLHEIFSSWLSLAPDTYGRYDRHEWIDVLEGLRWFGVTAPPPWYTAISPWHDDADVVQAVSDELTRIFGQPMPAEQALVHRKLDLLPAQEVLAFLARVPTNGVTRQSFWQWVRDVSESWELSHPRRSSRER